MDPGDIGRAVRWDANANAATELGSIAPAPGTALHFSATALNEAGTAIGYGTKYVGYSSDGTRGMRWSADGTATESDDLGTNAFGYTLSSPAAINASGTTVGMAFRWDATGNFVYNAIRWDANSPVANVLAETSSNAGASSTADANNTAGTIVGYATMATNAKDFVHAVAWNPNGTIIDLNALLSPADASIWTLDEAYGISDTNWVTGIGTYTGDKSVSQGFPRAFLIQLPEPTLLATFAASAALISTRRRRSTRE